MCQRALSILLLCSRLPSRQPDCRIACVPHHEGIQEGLAEDSRADRTGCPHSSASAIVISACSKPNSLSRGCRSADSGGSRSPRRTIPKRGIRHTVHWTMCESEDEVLQRGERSRHRRVRRRLHVMNNANFGGSYRQRSERVVPRAVRGIHSSDWIPAPAATGSPFPVLMQRCDVAVAGGFGPPGTATTRRRAGDFRKGAPVRGFSARSGSTRSETRLRRLPRLDPLR